MRSLGARGDSPPDAADPTSEPPLFSLPFVGVLTLAFLGFALESILRPVVPLMVLARGGDAVVVGVVAAVYALPALLFRPFIGSLVDTWHHAALLRLGTLASALVPPLLLVPNIASLLVVRFLHGTGWALYSVANHSLLAKLAPVHRRGEASGYFMAMPALATLVAPAVGVALYVAVGEVGPIALASAIGLAALVVSLPMRAPPSSTGAGGREPGSVSRLQRIVEPSALPVTAMVTTFMSAQSLFVVFPPVYAAAIGAPVESLALYYPVYGLVLTVSQVVAGRVSDRLGRTAAIRLGSLIAIVGLGAGLLAEGMSVLMVASAGYAMATALVSPTLSAMAIDRAPPERLGSAMATYSVGYQLATGMSSILWGTLIATVGFPWPFAFAIALQVLTIVITVRLAPTAGLSIR